jgi:hypothetical protein
MTIERPKFPPTRRPLISLSELFRDPFVAAAFRAAEDDGLAPALVDIDQPRTLDGGAAEIVPATGRRITVQQFDEVLA